MEDFGEILADIRARAEQPLPIRVRWPRIFLYVLVETIGASIIALVARERLAQLRFPDINAEMDAVIAEFTVLYDRPCSTEQIEQARIVLNDIMTQHRERVERERQLWLHGIETGAFLGLLILALLAVSGLLCLGTALQYCLVCYIVLFLLQVIAALIHINQWIKP